MAAALQPLRNNGTSALHSSAYPTIDYQDIRFSSLNHNKNSQRASTFVLESNRSNWDYSANILNEPNSRRSLEISGKRDILRIAEEQYQQHRAPQLPEIQALSSIPLQLHPQEQQVSFLPYSRPPSVARRAAERYSIDGSERTPSRSAAAEDRALDSAVASSPMLREPPSELSTPRQPSLNPVNVAGLGSGNNFSLSLSASQSYAPPVAPNPRAYAQQPTYITPPTTPTPIRTVFSPRTLPPEEICVECAMRDQDMADVDVTSPGVWDRESDIAFEDLKRRELEDEKSSVIPDLSRPRARGGRLTEQNLKLWLSINPREPASRQQTLKAYITSQRALLEAEAVAHARAQQEAKQLDSRMRDTYSQLRRSVHDSGSNGLTHTEDTGALRIKPPRSSTSRPDTSQAHSHSREITLLENGMIIEHVDVRKEEKEVKDQRRKDVRARKSSRSSVILDVASVTSGNSIGPVTDGGLPIHPRYSQASFSDVHSLGSSSPRRSKFFGAKHLSPGWRSQDSLAPSAISGSMVDMHVALQREGPIDPNTRCSQLWSTIDLPPDPDLAAQQETKSKKKKKLARIWGIVTGKHDSRPRENLSYAYPQFLDDDLPLAPPPPLSYLVNRSSGDLRAPNNRHISASTSQSLQKPNSLVLPSNSSSTLPSPPSSRLSEVENANSDQTVDGDAFHRNDGTFDKAFIKNAYLDTSEPNLRISSQTVSAGASVFPPISEPARVFAQSAREKSLPPLPGEPGFRVPNHILEPRPRTMYTYDPPQRPPGASPAHDFLPPSAPFRTQDSRRQSFNGMSSRPNLASHTMPQHRTGFDSRPLIGLHYDEFGTSRGSLNPFDQLQYSQQSGYKRKSKFGLSKILGKKNSPVTEQEDIGAHAINQFSVMNYSGSAGDDDVAVNSYATSHSRHSIFRPSTRASLNSRKALEERVLQDSQFVAYRYPSGDQQLDLFR